MLGHGEDKNTSEKKHGERSSIIVSRDVSGEALQGLTVRVNGISRGNGRVSTLDIIENSL